jgi:hypothetical protein
MDNKNFNADSETVEKKREMANKSHQPKNFTKMVYLQLIFGQLLCHSAYFSAVLTDSKSAINSFFINIQKIKI